jgi:alkaline phosphatase
VKEEKDQVGRLSPEVRGALVSLPVLFFLFNTLTGCRPAKPQATAADRPAAVVFFIGDGLGFPHIAITRDLLYGKEKRLALERGLPVTGIVSTWSSSNAVTDSGAAATALACGVKTDNRWVGQDPQRRPLACIADEARENGWKIGYLTTTRITHATPASFYAHGHRYDDEAAFPEQLLAQAPELALGGGADLFLPAERADGRDLLAAARRRGYGVWRQAGDLGKPAPARLLGLFAGDHLPFVLDEPRLPAAERPPSLAALTRFALAALGGGRGEGFFLLVEGGRIDHAAHGFDAAGTAAETRAFDQAVAEALAFQRRHQRTLILLTADHSTGGLAINDDVDWEALHRQRASVAWMVRQIQDEGAGVELIAEATGYGDFTAADLAAVRAPEDVYDAERVLGTLLARRHRVTWVPKVNLDDTKGHTGEDVPLYAGGPGAQRFAGVLDNAELPRRLAALLGWDWQPGPR